MNELVSHIEFLLHAHNCVIIPGFGGFVVNEMHSRKDGIATFLAPASELVFNRDLTHNDGLLAQSYMKSNQLMFESAMQRIELHVEELKHQLREQGQVELGKLGVFTYNNENRFVYTPSDFVRPALFGLNQANLKPLIQMQVPQTPLKQEHKSRQMRAVGIRAAAAVAVVVLMFLLPVSDTTIERQSAQMMAETSLFGDKSTHTNMRERTMEKSANDLPLASQEATPAAAAAEVPAETTGQLAAGGPHFYVVMGVYELPHVAEKMIETLRNEGFMHTGSLKRSGRIDVYAASFTDRVEADAFLREVHKQYPTHIDAWILKRK